jgi:hypothetical protein
MSGMDLVEFLNARLNEDERWARAAAKAMSDRDYPEGNPRWEPGSDKVMTDDGQIVVIGTFEYLDEAVATHIARHDPARVLADVAERRSIIYLLTDGCRIAYDRMAQANREVLHFLAHSYADHPDYREEWRS